MKKETQINNDTAAPEAAESVAVVNMNAPSAQDRGRLNAALRKLSLHTIYTIRPAARMRGGDYAEATGGACGSGR